MNSSREEFTVTFNRRNEVNENHAQTFCIGFMIFSERNMALPIHLSSVYNARAPYLAG